ncbi:MULTISPECIES: 1-acyl-sn-glycerol-3-phosphate acyltransferase [Flavobacteriaceae]|uniref:1-acyl-sn-glycerol-3-phosphate acyltransferase n=1 Tax=Flavobacteriaceae TaxID=49546 RepID=UPI0010AED721|nr:MULTISPECIES: 1-acyl-sn-glycerol-3-phosphate acyltransferase [Flavobacteriaceae]NJB35049.1 acyltransferase [Croceivirga sp. JEA036]TKD63415.1 acyltransferase [Flavobacterium sp. ASW18X]
MLRSLSKFILFRLLGWKLEGNFSKLKKYVIIVIPHTHWLDFPLGVFVRKIVGLDMHYIAKKALFKPPFGWFFRWTGGTPVDRNKNNNTVDAIVALFDEKDEFRLALAPEGTRKKVTSLKTGFYHIAKKAGVPIVMVAFDFRNKAVRIRDPFYPTSDIIADFKLIFEYYDGVTGKVSENSFNGDVTTI